MLFRTLAHPATQARVPLSAEDRAERDVDFARFDLGAVAEAHARDLDKAALSVEPQAVGAGRDDFSQFLAAHRAKGRRHDLLRVEQVEFFWLLLVAGFQRRPGARRRDRKT